MEHFTDSTQNDDFRKWLRENPQGFYLNHRGRPSMMLHRVGCSHLGDGEMANLSKYPKVCSVEKGELEIWVREQGKFVERCSTCDPR